MKTFKNFVVCVYANKFALFGYIFFAIGIYITHALISHIYISATIIILEGNSGYGLLLLTMGLALLFFTGCGSVTFNAYKKALGRKPEVLQRACSSCCITYCLKVGYLLAIRELKNPKPS